jgi:hypothetical protein
MWVVGWCGQAEFVLKGRGSRAVNLNFSFPAAAAEGAPLQ